MMAYLNEKEVKNLLKECPYVKTEKVDKPIFYRPIDGACVRVDFAEAAKHFGYDKSSSRKEVAVDIFTELEKKANAFLTKKHVRQGQTRGTHRARFVHKSKNGDNLCVKGVLSFEEERCTFDRNEEVRFTITAGIEVTLYSI